ncbi:hypothetical protein Pint_31205 [Pistacia integerrima]|uniref:Uncharacterized protein n=1 Tax=Pistacia integerrima TaxID=434235 RepID=A0ACC0XNN7_9ROSI|nr:hypothetical protein Pint_31205 [Pistacia integerrima]
MAQKKENIVMFPFMAQGHINPFLALALRIEKTKKFTITFVNTPLNIKKLRSFLPSNSSIHLLEIPFNSSDHDLPPNSENMDSLPYHFLINLFQASLSLKPHFRKLISNLIHQQKWTENEEIDKLGLTYFRRKFGRQVWPVGPVLLTLGSQARSRRDFGISPEECKNWLDKKPSCSVIYVSFGSMNTISASQMMQLAMALEGCGKNFIWVVRPPLGFDINSEFRANEWLPEGFEEKIKVSGRGLLVRKWAPQVQILSHKSLSAFLSHCGWNSVLESLSHGVPMIGWPVAAEQSYNVKLLEDTIGVCVEVARGKRSEVFHEDIVEKIKLVMNESEKRKEMRERALQIKEIINNAIENEENFKGSSMEAMDQFLNAALKLRGEDKGKIHGAPSSSYEEKYYI